MKPAATTTKDKYRALLSSASKTAGSDNWKTSAGRLDGPDNFVIGDAWRCLKLQFKSNTTPSVCPVCLEKPASETDWYITKSCRHAVCRECLQEYAASLISDPNHSGALKCPCCPRLLRVEDATAALDKQRPAQSGCATKSTFAKQSTTPTLSPIRSKRKGFIVDSGNESDAIGRQALDVLERWDNKVRDEMLRSMGDFRPCPHCSDRNPVDQSNKHNNNQGGGFVTPECLAVINDEREANAERLLKLTGAPSAMAVLLSYAIYYLYCSSSENSMSNGGQIAVALQIASALIPSLLLPILPHALGVIFSVMARKGLMSPISVNCPCCFKDFDLEASSELQLGGGASSNAGAEAATQQWKLSHTRPCPGCSSPIMKDEDATMFDVGDVVWNFAGRA
ncbi:hypothetical protein ACHAXH_007775 [Discostella pseudostelligera]